MTSQVVDPSGQASQEARRAVWRGPAWGEVLLSARLIGFTKLVTWTVLCMRLPAPDLQVCPSELQVRMRELQVMVTVGKASCIHLVVLAGVELNIRRYGASKLLGMYEGASVQRHCRCVGAAECPPGVREGDYTSHGPKGTA
ncbi:uncharacterized protein [Procambarus clarkii]|uniref:uncharacterized protein isoform X2 n=1 Tax=Procambarus clarkii TaxID=6728 RepID=UPI003743CB7B